MPLVRKVVDWVDVRLGVRDLLEQNLSGYLLPKNVNVWYSLGSVLLALFGLQIATGFLLLIYYVPDTTKAFESVVRIMNDIPYGWLIRYLHMVGSNMIIVVLLLHMLSVMFMGSYKRPREITWLSGFLLFNLGMGLCLTGYLLPWSQLSFWATTIATDAAGTVPVIGGRLVEFLRGGTSVGDPTLGRFFALHVMGMPLLLGAGIGLHLFCVRRIGISQPPFGPEAKPAEVGGYFHHEEHPGGIPFFPNYTVEDGAMVCFFLALICSVVFFAPQLFMPEEALVPADPFSTPAHIKPEWYFLWAYQTLKIFPTKLTGLAAQGAFMTFLALLPFIDRGAERRPARRPLFVTCFVLGILLFVGLSIWGHLS
ncbi:cytochrome bc complex cytochrome b subunit [Desulfuromonas carbonis]|uniref:cytochrome b n=1 Tax=Desulfuromonas sp. DDH964 TaxID=1823759 RepID=UPI00078CC259|nr:cytochrome bc complex cytochrome b subunit [Desulfuromonas sp. DDH964]AMV73033.1 cytochrome b/b6 complex, cytochrome b subunit [Desulfuromonas sp. DDH964]